MPTPRIPGSSAPARASDLGRFVGSMEARVLAADANRHAPTLRTHDRYGNRVDHVDFHPAYHALMARALGACASTGMEAKVIVTGQAVPCSSWFQR